jgi:hypothetical protein
MKRQLMLILSILVVVMLAMGCNKVDDPAGDTATLNGVVADEGSMISSRLASDSSTVDLSQSSITVSQVNADGSEEVLIEDVSVNANGTFQANVPSHAKNLKVCVHHNNGQKKCSFYADDLSSDGENIVEPITDSSDVLVSLVEGEITDENVDPSNVDVSELSDWIEPDVANRINALDIEQRTCILRVFHGAVVIARHAFYAALQDANVVDVSIGDFTNKLQTIRQSLKEARRTLRADLYEAIVNDDYDGYLAARLVYRDTISDIFEQARIPRVVYAKALQLAHEEFEKAVFHIAAEVRSSGACIIPDGILRYLHARAIGRKIHHDARVLTFVLTDEFSYSGTAIRDAVGTFIESVKALDTSAPIDMQLIAAVETFYATARAELKGAVDDTFVADTAIDTIDAAIVAAQVQLKTDLEAATTLEATRIAFHEFHTTIQTTAHTTLGIDISTPLQERAQKTMILDLLMMMHHPIFIHH